MGTSGYEIRHSLLSEAKEKLYTDWHGAVEVESRTADVEKRAPKAIPPPDIKDILTLAETMYAFVCKK